MELEPPMRMLERLRHVWRFHPEMLDDLTLLRDKFQQAGKEFEKKVYSTGQTSDWQQTAIRIFKETMEG